MTEIVMELEPGCLDRASRADVAVVEAMMHWPDDIDARLAWRRACFIEDCRDAIDELPVDLLRTYAHAVTTSPRLVELQPAAGERHVFGSMVGRLTLEAVVLAKLDPENAGIMKLRRRLADDMKVPPGESGGYQIEPQTMANRNGPLYKFRPVAHLWAAWFQQWNITGDKTFPYRMPGLGRFLGLAETIREMAEQTRTGHTPHAVMRPGEAVGLPDHVTVPRVSINLPSPD